MIIAVAQVIAPTTKTRIGPNINPDISIAHGMINKVDPHMKFHTATL